MADRQFTALEEEYLAHTARYGGSVGYGGAVNGGTSGGGVTRVNANGSVSTGNVSNLVGVKENSDGSTTRTYQNPDGSLTSETHPNQWGLTTTIKTSTQNGITTISVHRGSQTTITETRDVLSNRLLSETVVSNNITDDGVNHPSIHRIVYGPEFNYVYWRTARGNETWYNVRPDGTTFDRREYTAAEREADFWREYWFEPVKGPRHIPDGDGSDKPVLLEFLLGDETYFVSATLGTNDADVLAADGFVSGAVALISLWAGSVTISCRAARAMTF